jgi:hypothetical protein
MAQNNRYKIGFTTAIALLSFSLPAHAALITFAGSDAGANSTDPRPNSTTAAASFDAAAGALGGISLINFESAPLGSFSSLTLAPGVTASGSDTSIRDTPVGSPDNLYGYNTTSGGANFESLFGGTADFAFTTPIDAFGAYFAGLQGSLVGQEIITFSDGSTQTINLPNLSGGIAFVGFIDSGKSITGIHINVLNDIVSVDDVRYGPSGPSPVPEPSSLLLLAGGMIAFAGRFRQRARQ